jgi:hypothetical protein
MPWLWWCALVFVFVQRKSTGKRKRKRKERKTATERQYCLGGDACVRWVRGNFFFYGPGPLKCWE